MNEFNKGDKVFVRVARRNMYSDVYTVIERGRIEARLPNGNYIVKWLCSSDRREVSPERMTKV